jgi:uncharacterized protein involved in exopolysaccharide biosynthesis
MKTTTHKFAYLGEDAGERNHQDGAKVDRWLGAMQVYAHKEAFKSKDKVRNNNPKVEAKIAELIKKKNKHKSSGDTKTQQTGKRQKQIEAQEVALPSVGRT